MKENNEEEIDLTKKDNLNVKSQNLNQEKDSIFMVVIHLPNKKAFSLEVPQSWSTKKLLNFINLTFKLEFKKMFPIFVFHGNSLSLSSESPLTDYFHKEKVNHIIITLKKGYQDNNSNVLNNLNLKTNKEVFKSEEFSNIEKLAINDYFKIFKNNAFNNFPLMNPAYNHRREQIKQSSVLERLADFEPMPLEDFPFRNYFQLKIIFKCFISFIAFGIYIKGFNFFLFLAVLIGYYWYCVSNVLDEFYKKKIQQIGLSEEEYKRMKTDVHKYTDLFKAKAIFIIDDDEDKKEENNKEKEKININNNNNINLEPNTNKKNIEEALKDGKQNLNEFMNSDLLKEKNNFIFSKEDQKDDNKDKEDEKDINEVNPTLNNINDILTGNNNIRNQNKNIKNDNKEEKKEESQQNENEEEQEEVRQESIIDIVIEIIKVFFISFIPALCDEYEANHPIPVNDYQANNGNENENENNENAQMNENNDNNININNNNDNGDENKLDDDSNNNNHKVSSSKVANLSEDSNRDNRPYKLIKRDNPSVNENEYVFSEHGAIDDLSINSELYKQKKEKEKEKEKEIEKEKRIFEEDEEYLIEDDNKQKNE